jgi:hypothetical protein
LAPFTDGINEIKFQVLNLFSLAKLIEADNGILAMDICKISAKHLGSSNSVLQHFYYLAYSLTFISPHWEKNWVGIRDQHCIQELSYRNRETDP